LDRPVVHRWEPDRILTKNIRKRISYLCRHSILVSSSKYRWKTGLDGLRGYEYTGNQLRSMETNYDTAMDCRPTSRRKMSTVRVLTCKVLSRITRLYWHYYNENNITQACTKCRPLNFNATYSSLFNIRYGSNNNVNSRIKECQNINLTINDYNYIINIIIIKL